MKNFENQLKPENNNPQTLQEKILVIEKNLVLNPTIPRGSALGFPSGGKV